MSSCERPSKSSASDLVPASVSKLYSFSTGTHGRSRRFFVSSSFRRVSSFSSASSLSRSACHSSWVPTACSGIASCLLVRVRRPAGRRFAIVLVETPDATGRERSIPFARGWVITHDASETASSYGSAVLTERILARARDGDEHAFRELTDPYRRELQLHCYRIVGSVQDAEDLLQETLLAAWRALDRFEGRSSVRTWLYRIATNRCLNALRDSGRRPQEVPAMVEPPEPTRRAEPIWLEPYPDRLLEGVPDDSPGPDTRYETREAMALAFVAALQHLPPRQRAVLVLRDVLGFRAAEVAETIGITEASANNALHRARAALETRLPTDRERPPQPRSPRERTLAARFADAVESGDVDGMVSLITDDALLTMPPLPLEYQGHEAIAGFLR